MKIINSKGSTIEIFGDTAKISGNSAVLFIHKTNSMNLKFIIEKNTNAKIFSIYSNACKIKSSIFLNENSKLDICDIFFGNVNVQNSISLEWPNCMFNLVSKGIINANEHAFYAALASISKSASKANVNIEEHAYLLEKEARVNLIPALEIDNNDVEARHASSISEIDYEQIFYLMNRGFSEKQARETIVSAFLSHEFREIKELFDYEVEDANMKILVFGNPSVKCDSIALKVAEKLKEKFEFVFMESMEEIENAEQNIVILDSAKGIKKVTLIEDISALETNPIYSMHDFDIAFMLKLLKKIKKINSVRIIAVPVRYNIEKAVKEVKDIFCILP